MSALLTIQAASIFYLDNLLATAFALYTRLFWLHFLHRHCLQSLFSGFVVFNSFLKAVGEALHSLLYISFSEFAGTSTNSTISYLASLCLDSVAFFSCLQFQPVFYFIDIFSTHIFLDFSYFTPRWRQRGGLPHQVLLFTLFFCWNVHSSSFCTERAAAISISCSCETECPCLYKEICYKDIFAWR